MNSDCNSCPGTEVRTSSLHELRPLEATIYLPKTCVTQVSLVVIVCKPWDLQHRSELGRLVYEPFQVSSLADLHNAVLEVPLTALYAYPLRRSASWGTLGLSHVIAAAVCAERTRESDAIEYLPCKVKSTWSPRSATSHSLFSTLQAADMAISSDHSPLLLRTNFAFSCRLPRVAHISPVISTPPDRLRDFRGPP
jgi:hypothetical protein